MLKTEIKRRQINEAKKEGRVDAEGNPLIVSPSGIPYVCKSTLLMKILDALEKFMYRR